jgi:hypothetical protein
MRLSIWMIASMISGMLYAQTGTLEGNVKGSNGDTVSYANVVIYTVNGMVDGTQADSKGKYIIRKIPAGTYIIRFSRVGFETQSTKDIVIESGKTTYLDAVLNGPIDLGGTTVTDEKKAKRKKGRKKAEKESE